MIKEVLLPEVSENIESGDVVKVLVKVGDVIKADQPVIELETDKAVFEVPSTESGEVKELNVKEGEKIKIGQVILKVESNGKADTTEKKDEKKKMASPEITASVPEVKKEETVILESPVPVVDKVLSASVSDDTIQSATASAPASPSVRRLARELGVDIALVRGGGSAGRITEDDVKLHVKERMSGGTSTGTVAVQKPLPDFSKWGKIRIEPMSKVRSLTADSMTYAWSTIPMVTQFDKADITSLEDFRKKYSGDVEKSGGRLTVTSILTAVSALALREFPNFNTSIDLARREIVFKEYCNIGIAVDTDRGLLVPVVKNADTKSITEISVEISELAEKARMKKITPEEMDGGNFTISNLGGIGGTGFTPIVYSPQVAIMGVSRSSWEPVYVGEKFLPKLMLPLSLTYDHRIIDGAAAARFLRWICDALENPLSIFL
jgi:pyruvate dehydrogenase E2 component (dihydrolipoamide acetyltransferase)